MFLSLFVLLSSPFQFIVQTSDHKSWMFLVFHSGKYLFAVSAMSALAKMCCYSSCISKIVMKRLISVLERKKTFFLFFSQFVCKLFLMNTGKDKIILKVAMNEKVLDQISSLALTDTPFMSSHHTQSKSLWVWITPPHQTLSAPTWINREQLLIHLYLHQHNPLSLIPPSFFF